MRGYTTLGASVYFRYGDNLTGIYAGNNGDIIGE